MYVVVANLFPEVSNLQFATQYKHLYSKALQDLLFKICKVGQWTCIIVLYKNLLPQCLVGSSRKKGSKGRAKPQN